MIAEIPQDWRKQKIYSWRVHTRSSVHQDPGKKAITDKKKTTLFIWAEDVIIQFIEKKIQMTNKTHANNC